MAYFRIIFKEDNKLWRKYFTFAYRFVIGDNEEVKFPENYTLQSSDVLKIQALNHQGEVVKDISFFKKEKMSPFQRTRSHILVREDIFQEELFKNLKKKYEKRLLLDIKEKIEKRNDCLIWENKILF